MLFNFKETSEHKTGSMPIWLCLTRAVAGSRLCEIVEAVLDAGSAPTNKTQSANPNVKFLKNRHPPLFWVRGCLLVLTEEGVSSGSWVSLKKKFVKQVTHLLLAPSSIRKESPR